jgi:hypothetical protein
LKPAEPVSGDKNPHRADAILHPGYEENFCKTVHRVIDLFPGVLIKTISRATMREENCRASQVSASCRPPGLSRYQHQILHQIAVDTAILIGFGVALENLFMILKSSPRYTGTPSPYSSEEPLYDP